MVLTPMLTRRIIPLPAPIPATANWFLFVVAPAVGVRLSAPAARADALPHHAGVHLPLGRVEHRYARRLFKNCAKS